jgi:hypothetical protein
MPLGIHNCALRRWGELAGGGERWLEHVNKRHERSIGLTTDRLRVVAQAEMMPASGGGETAAVLPPRLGFRRREVQFR